MAKKNRTMGKNCKRNPEYSAISYLIKKMEKKNEETRAKGTWPDKEERKSLRRALVARRKIKSVISNPEWMEIKYVRYADDWMIGVWGTKEKAKLLKNTVDTFLKSLKLTLSVEKTLITNAREETAKFLGVYIKKVATPHKTTKSIKDVQGHTRRTSGVNLWMTAPIDTLVKRLVERGFAKLSGTRWLPQSITTLSILPLKELISRFRTILSGFLNYYSFVDNRRALKEIYWLLRESLRKTISRKLSIGKSEFRRLFGKDIHIITTGRDGKCKKLSFECPSLIRKPMEFLGAGDYKDPLSVKDWKISSLSAMGQSCSNCGEPNNVEMHHLKHLRTLNTKLDSFGQMMARINRKQVPLCRECHVKVHAGTYHGMSIRHFKYIKWQGKP